MQCPTCQSEARKFGHDRAGNQRFQCQTCRKTFSDRPARPLDEMRLPLDKALFCLQLLTEGNSIRATVRISGVAKGTVIALLVCVGEKCEAFLRDKLRSVPASDVQADEIWGFVGMKEKTKTRKENESPDVGDAYCFVAIERMTKLVLAWYLGKRDQASTRTFLVDVERSTRGRIQLSTDGFKPYPSAVQLAFAEREVDHGTLVKEYATKADDHRYSPGEVIGTVKNACCGSPDKDKICTSHVERHNLQMRMQNRRLTRLTNAFSKKWSNHDAALGLYFAEYNFVRPHGTLTKRAEGIKTTPAMAAGLTDHPWTLLELLEAAAASTH
jgi:transposase-like protein/IS1 family transposase